MGRILAVDPFQFVSSLIILSTRYPVRNCIHLNMVMLEEWEELQNRFRKNQKTREHSAHSSKVHSVNWSCDGRKLASGSFDKTVCLFSLSNDRLNKEHTYRGHGDSVDQLCWHPSNPDLLATASGDKSVRIWDARASKNGRTIAVGNKEDLVTFIDCKTHKIKHEEAFKFEVNEISWNHASDLFFLTNGHGCIHVLNYPEMELKYVLQAHPGNCICIKFDPTGKYFAVGSADALVSLWDANELACLLLRRIFQIDVGHVESGNKVCDVSVTSPTFTIAWHPKRYLLAYACDDKDKYDHRDAGSLKVWGFPSDD
ncbi:THOC3 [Lepeophtheirus salmonis]|uniref:THOC3 n=1 Tax=Lepeophtheirus salmonis TaxID=72036 RepID=A0A7R8D008_LEPSM|nr:THOC3 [Lepeophtheirus salmonis]CAF2980104.1 THOC3 [Lepeophtheirus salmonis]